MGMKGNGSRGFPVWGLMACFQGGKSRGASWCGGSLSAAWGALGAGWGSLVQGGGPPVPGRGTL